jgi:fucose 4-O-acetylase-like acetyltransferase
MIDKKGRLVKKLAYPFLVWRVMASTIRILYIEEHWLDALPFLGGKIETK